MEAAVPPVRARHPYWLTPLCCHYNPQHPSCKNTLPSIAEVTALGALAPPVGVLLRLSSRPSSFRGALGAASSSGICF